MTNQHVLEVATMLTMMNDGQTMESHRGNNRRLRSVGPEPHVFTEEEGQEIARQIAAQQKAKRRKRGQQ